jgi:hypothetical protein
MRQEDLKDIQQAPQQPLGTTKCRSLIGGVCRIVGTGRQQVRGTSNNSALPRTTATTEMIVALKQVLLLEEALPGVSRITTGTAIGCTRQRRDECTMAADTMVHRSIAKQRIVLRGLMRTLRARGNTVKSKRGIKKPKDLIIVVTLIIATVAVAIWNDAKAIENDDQSHRNRVRVDNVILGATTANIVIESGVLVRKSPEAGLRLEIIEMTIVEGLIRIGVKRSL